MDETFINIRVFSWHLQLLRSLRPRIGKNEYHKANGWPDGYFSVYRFFWITK